MRSVALIAAVLASGCFYVEDINQRPSMAIEQQARPDGSFKVHRGDKAVTFKARSDDPDDDYVVPRWAAKACANFDQCDEDPFAEGTAELFSFDVPVDRADVPEPVTTIVVFLNGRDVLGADAVPGQEAIVPVLDAPPDLDVFDTADYKRVATTPIDIFVEYGDADDGPDGVVIDVQVAPPPLGTFTLVEIPAATPTDPERGQVARRLVPSVEGAWNLIVTATSVGGETREVPYVVNVGVDQPPCIQTLSPSVPPAGTVLPMSEATLFQVLFVDDALDRFPTVANDPFLGPTEFEWSLKVGSGPREVLGGATGNGIALDPASFTPGDIVELRVEVSDRTQTPITCSDELASCSVLANACLQRQTWHVEVH